MDNREQLIQALSNLPDDVKKRLSSATPEQKKIFVDGLASKLGSMPSEPMQNTVQERPNAAMELNKSMQEFTPSDLMPGLGNLGGLKKTAGLALQAASVPFQLGESVLSNRALRSQQQGSVGRGMAEFFNPMTIGKDLQEGLLGPQKNFGDVYQKAGLSEGQASAAGLATMLGLTAPDALVGAGKLGVGLAKGGKNLVSEGVNFLKSGTKRRLDFLNEVRSGIQAVPTKARQSFANDLIRLNNEKVAMGQNPSINLRNMVDDLITNKASGEMEPAVKEAINRVPKLSKIIKNPDLAENLTLKESQDLLNDVKAQLSQSKLSGVGNRSTDIPLYDDIVNEITDAQLSIHPELAPIKKAYGEVMNNYRLIRNKIKPGALDKNVSNKFGDVEINNAVESLLSNQPNLINKINKTRRLGKLKSVGVKATIGGVALEEAVRRGLFSPKP